MKRLLLLAFAIPMLAACGAGYETNDYVEDGDFKAVGDVGTYDILRDVRTGCQYLQPHSTTASLTPYYDEDGKVKGCGEDE